jgi:hypothetical protein
MFTLYSRRTALILLLVSSLISHVCAQSCDTNQNPYCAGDSQFAQLCCPYPAVCYYANRYGAVGCCQPGQICRGTGATIIPVQTTQITQIIQTTYTTQMQTTQPTPTTQNGGYSTITITGGLAPTTVATAIGYTTTGGVIIANDASRALVRHATHFSVGLAVLAWIIN